MVVRDGPEVQISYRVGEPHSVLHILTADFVVVSTSAKATRLITFKPPLSLDEVDVLRWVHYTSATKVVLACNEPFWEQDGIWGGVSITDRPSRYIYYPSHSLPSSKGIPLASCTLDDDSLFFISMRQDQVVDIVLEDLSVLHWVPKEAPRCMRPSSVIKYCSLDPLVLGAFSKFTPYQFENYLQHFFQPALHPLCWRAHLPAPCLDRYCHQVQPLGSQEHPSCRGRGSQGRQPTFTNTQACFSC